MRPPAVWKDESGVTAVEFALIAPVFLMAVLGVFDLAHNMYTEAMLQGAIQKASRDATIEGAADNEAQLDGRVAHAVHTVAPGSAVVFNRRAYSSFSSVGAPEDFIDVDGDGLCNNGESFEDANRNGFWDSDRGTVGFGGARDAVLYTVTVTYQRFFPVANFIGQSETMTLRVSTVLRNQPYGLQSNTTPPVEQCL